MKPQEPVDLFKAIDFHTNELNNQVYGSKSRKDHGLQLNRLIDRQDRNTSYGLKFYRKECKKLSIPTYTV